MKALAELNRTTMALYDELERDGIECEMERAGVLFLFLSESAMRHALDDLSGLDQLGYQPPQPLLEDEIRQLEPALSMKWLLASGWKKNVTCAPRRSRPVWSSG